MQEITLARKAVIHCGQDTISWSKFAVAVELFLEGEKAMKCTFSYNHIVAFWLNGAALSDYLEGNPYPSSFAMISSLGASLLVNTTNHLFRCDDEFDQSQSNSDSDSNYQEVVHIPPPDPVGSHRREPLLSLEYLVSTLTLFETTVPHDSFYALLSIAKETATTHAEPRVSESVSPKSLNKIQPYKIDYQAPYVDACRDFIQFILRDALKNDRGHRSRALDIICRPWAIDQNTLSSINGKREMSEIRREARKNGKLRFLNSDDLTLPSWIPQLSKAPYGMIRLGMDMLRALRKNADPLVGLTSSSGQVYSAAGFKNIDLGSLKFRKRTSLVHQPDHYSMYTRGFCLDAIEHVSDVSMIGLIPMSWVDLGGWTSTKGLPPSRFWRTLVSSPTVFRIPLAIAQRCKSSFLL